MRGPDDRVVVARAEISPDGRFAARVFAPILIASAAALIVLSWDEAWRRCATLTTCERRAAGAILLSIGSIAAIGWGVGILVRVRWRTLAAWGSSRYVWAIAGLLALGSVFIAARIPAFTCGRGRFDDTLAMCMHPPSASEPTSWLLLKEAIVVIGLVAALVVAVRPRDIRVTAPFAVAVWGAGYTWLLVETMA